jgi:hypothetical protein
LREESSDEDEEIYEDFWDNLTPRTSALFQGLLQSFLQGRYKKFLRVTAGSQV